MQPRIKFLCALRRSLFPRFLFSKPVGKNVVQEYLALVQEQKPEHCLNLVSISYGGSRLALWKLVTRDDPEEQR